MDLTHLTINQTIGTIAFLAGVVLLLIELFRNGLSKISIFFLRLLCAEQHPSFQRYLAVYRCNRRAYSAFWHTAEVLPARGAAARKNRS